MRDSTVCGEFPYYVWRVEYINDNPWFIMIRMLVVRLTLAFMIFDMYTRQGPIPGGA